jgi:hypothetical protein
VETSWFNSFQVTPDSIFRHAAIAQGLDVLRTFAHIAPIHLKKAGKTHKVTEREKEFLKREREELIT